MRILMMINALGMGGAETFFTRLAVGLRRRGHTVVVHVPSFGGDASLLNKLSSSGIPVFVPWWYRPSIYRWIYKLSLMIQHLVPNYSLVDHLRSSYLHRLYRRYRFDAVNAHLTFSERAACVAFRSLPVRIVGSDHGDYRYTITTPERIREMEPVFSRSDALICPSLDNLAVAKRFPWSSRARMKVVYYGFESPVLESAPKSAQTDTLVYGMLARGDEAEKGWHEAIEAFRIVRQKFGAKVKLLLVGSGCIVDEIRASVDSAVDEGIDFAGYQADPCPFIARFDVALLPTCFRAESLPCVIIESLAQGKPVIATGIGGIPEMLLLGNECAGAIIPLNECGRASVPHLADVMIRFFEDKGFRARCVELTVPASERFNMDRCLGRYEDVLSGLNCDPT
jgi:glycosyltransferase involved in cell wall biosynthesis